MTIRQHSTELHTADKAGVRAAACVEAVGVGYFFYGYWFSHRRA